MRLFLSSLFILTGCMLSAQIYEPVAWKSSFEHVGGDQYILVHQATIDEGWSMYSQFLESDEGPVATTITYDGEDHFDATGAYEEVGNKKEGFDEIFEMNVIKFYDQVLFRQKITLKESQPITGYINFMVCDATKCLPPTDYEFSLNPKPKLVDDSNIAPAASKSSKKKETNEGQGNELNQGGGNPFGDASTVSGGDQRTDSEPVVEAEEVQSSGIVEPVVWSFDIDSEGKARATAKVQDGWHIYSNSVGPDDGPIPTEVYIGDEAVAIAEKAAKTVTGMDEIFEVEITKLKEQVELTFDFPQGSQTLSGEVVYMACDKSRCIMPDPAAFTIDPVARTIAAFTNELDENSIVAPKHQSIYALDPELVDEPLAGCEDVEATVVADQGFWAIFGLGFIGGLLALLTPCVFPMIPLTVSFFTKGSENRRKGLEKAFLYGFFILLIYLLLSAPFHLMDSINPDILNDISTNVVLNLVFFAIFLFFAFSFFGFYEITMPESWSNKASQAEGVGGLLGIFFMALTLALVSFSCTGPILGTLLAGALTSDGGALQLTAGMGGFGLALALPFALFAAFPGIMGSIPKSGGWLNTVKVVLGFLELGLAFKFLSAADLVKRWGLLKIEPFLIIEIVIFLGLALYLFGKIKFPHDSPIKKLSIGRMSLGLVSLLFAVYLASGFRVNKETNTFQSLTLLSGLAPPVGYSWIYPNKCPNNLDCFKDLESGMAHAKKVGKPVMIDFTGHACVNCRRMEEHVWPKAPVIDHLKNNYVLISLYVDEKIALPEEEQQVVARKTGGTRKLRTVGHKWTHFQTEFFNNNSQPYYVLLSPEGKLLNNPVGYMPDAEEYAAFLDCGLGNYQAQEESLGYQTN